jgi:hypothetical protein
VKEYDGISEKEIIEAAILYATQFGWNVKASDCRVKPLPSRPIREGGQSTPINLPISNWRVYLTSKETPTVDVKRIAGSTLAGDNFRGPERP